MKFFTKITVFILAVYTLYAQDIEMNFGGYIENISSILITKKALFSDLATARFESVWEYKKKGALDLQVVLSAGLQPIDPFQAFKNGSCIMNNVLVPLTAAGASMLDSNQMKQFTQIEPLVQFIPFSSLYSRDKITLDRALIKLYFEKCDLYIGRQMIAWGTGYAFNPTDVWNKKNPLDPQAPKSGINAARVEVPFGALSGLTLIVSPCMDFKHSSAGFRVKGFAGGFDFSFSGIRLMNADYALFDIPPKMIAGFDCAGQLGDIGVWMETAAINPLYPAMNTADLDSLYWQVDAGLDYTFKNGLYVMGEYYYNGLGKDSYKDYAISDYIHIFTGDMSGFASQYTFISLRKNITDHVIFSGSTLFNLDDYSAMILPSLEYEFSSNIVMMLSGQIGVGDKVKSEFGSVYSSTSLKVTGYF